jgi:ATP-dependent DNA helicase RecG
MNANLPPLDEITMQALIEQPESDSLEFKSTLLTNLRIAEYVVGIGNAGGGLLVMGVTDKKPRRIVGIAALSVDELQTIRRSVYASTGIRVDLEPVSTTYGFVLAVHIPPRPRGNVFHTSDGKYLVRVGGIWLR